MLLWTTEPARRPKPSGSVLGEALQVVGRPLSDRDVDRLVIGLADTNPTLTIGELASALHGRSRRAKVARTVALLSDPEHNPAETIGR